MDNRLERYEKEIREKIKKSSKQWRSR